TPATTARNNARNPASPARTPGPPPPSHSGDGSPPSPHQAASPPLLPENRKYTACSSQPKIPTAYFTPDDTGCADQNPSTTAASVASSAAPYINAIASFEAATSALTRGSLPGRRMASPSRIPAIPATTMPSSSKDECPLTNDQNDSGS